MLIHRTVAWFRICDCDWLMSWSDSLMSAEWTLYSSINCWITL